MIENIELFVSRVSSSTYYRITIADFFDNVLNGDFINKVNSHGITKLRNTKFPRMRFAKWGF